MADLVADVRYALKWLARSPAFAAVAIASLAIGVGFNSALFSIVDALLLRSLPIEEPGRVVDVFTRAGDGDLYATSSYPDFLDFRDQNQVFTGMTGYSPMIAAVKTPDGSRLALGEVVTGGYFQLLGVPAVHGRVLLPEDDRPTAPRVAVISHRAWTRQYGGDPSAVGRTVRLHGQPYTIVGVVSPRFTGMVPMLQPELWVPAAWVEDVEPAGIQESVPSPTGNSRLERRGQRWLFVKGRLKEGETAASAEANLQVIMSRLAASHPKTNEKRPISVVANVRVHPAADKALRPIAIGLMLGVGLVLLVATLLAAVGLYGVIAYSVARRTREIGIRVALGAAPQRVVGMVMRQGLGVAGAGIAVGLLLAAAAAQVLASALYGVSALDPIAWAGALSVSLVSAAAANFIPARRAAKVDPSRALRAE